MSVPKSPLNSSSQLPALLWVHGIFGSPREYGTVIPFFEADGYPCRALTLPAHGPAPALTFAEVEPEDFLQHVFQQVEVLAQELDRPVILIGHSLGGILALAAAGQRPRGLAGVVALAAAHSQAHLLTPGWHRVPFRRLLQAIRYIPDYWHGFEKPRLPLRQVPRFRQKGYHLLSLLRAGLPNIHVPVLLAHSPYDLSIPWEEQHKLYQSLKLAGVPVTSITLENCGHQIFPLSKAQEQVIAVIRQFLQVVKPQGVNA